MKKIILVGFLSSFGFGQSGFEIAKMVDEKPSPKDMSNTTRMVLTNAKGKSRTNVMVSKPKDDKGVAFLKIEHDDKDDEMRMWLPAFKKIRRISSKKKGDSFMGSDLSYEDLSNRDLDKSEYTRLDDETINGVDCFVLEITPKKEAKSSYSKHTSWIDKNSLMAVKEESYDKSGALKKKKEFSYREMKGYFVMKRVFVEDVQKNRTTEVAFEDVKVDTGIKENLFQEKNLKRLPRN